MEQLTPTFPNIVRSLDKLKILLFWEILKTKNPYLLDADYMPDKVYSEEEQDYICEAWEIMYDSYFQLKNDGKSKLVLSQAYEQMILANKIGQLQKNIDFIRHLINVKHHLTKDNYLEKELMLVNLFLTIEPDLSVEPEKGLEHNLAVVKKRIFALENKYNRIKKDNDKKVEDQVDNIFSVLVRVSQILGYQLNADKMVVSEWLAWEQAAKDKRKAEEEAARKRKKK